VTEYDPGALVALADVANVNVPPSDDIESPFTNPAPLAVNAGSAAPYTFVALVVCTVNAARAIAIAAEPDADV
jgi:hypothetical protein